MRNREEFKSLVYEKRDRLLYEELEAKKKLNKRKKIYASLSSAMAAIIVMAVVIPNAGKWMNIVNNPILNEAPEKGENEGNGGYDKDQNLSVPDEAPAESDVSEEHCNPMETEAEWYPEVNPAETEGDNYYPEPEEPTDEEITPDAFSSIQVKFTATLSTYGGESAKGNEGVVGSLDGEMADEVSEEILIITDYEDLKQKFESLCTTTHAAAVFGGNEIFSEDRVVLVIERLGGDPSDNEVTYQCIGVEDGILYLVRKNVVSGDYEVPAIEVRCVDFVVLNKYGYDMSTIENIVITK